MTEIERILSLPVSDLDAEAIADYYTKALNPEGKGEWRLRPHQGLALYWAKAIGGGFFPMDVGAGKTLIAFAIPQILGAVDETLVLAPAGLANEAEKEFAEYAPQFPALEPVRYVSHAKFSREDFIEELFALEPKVLIIDEAQTFCGKGVSARKQLLKAYLKAHPDTQVYAMTATFASNSIEEYAWLIDVCLGATSPVPAAYSTRQVLASFIDANYDGGPMTSQYWQIQEWVEDPRFRVEADTLVERVRGAYRNRFTSAPGVVVTEESSCDAQIHLIERDFQGIEDVHDLRDSIANTWQTPRGEWLDDPLALNRKTREASQGFFYYWDWPNGEIDREWLTKRNAYAAGVARITRKGDPHYATRSRVERGLEEGVFSGEEIEDLYAEWQEVWHRPEPPTKAQWETDAYLEAVEAEAEAQVAEGRKVSVWYEHVAVAQRLAERGFRVCFAGDEVPRDGEPIALSIASHGTGLNLQAWDTMIVMCSPSNMGRWQQLIGRLHRAGQEAPDVRVIIATHTAELAGAWASAKRKALAYQENHGLKQKVLLGFAPRSTED